VDGPFCRVGGEIVGVVADTREGGPMSEPRPTIYVVQAQFPVGTLAVAVRRTPGGAGVPALRTVLAALDPDVPMYRVRTTEQLAAASVAQPRLAMLLMSLFGVAALVVAASGLYGVLAQVVEARRQEIGIRRAVGAGVNHVVGLVARDTLGQLVSGVTTGVACAVALTAVLPRLASDATAPDAGAYVAAIGVFSVAAVLAAAVPCYRALAADPAVTLKGD
jgi:putative ABC transport system permease protein